MSTRGLASHVPIHEPAGRELPVEAHATDIKDREAFDGAVTALADELRRRDWRAVRMVNRERVDFGGREVTYTHMLAELVIRVFESARRAGHEHVRIDVVPAKVYLGDDEEGFPRFLESEDYWKPLREHLALAAVRLGAPAHIYLDAWPREPYGGHIDRIWPTADRQKATVEVRIAFDALDERLRPEMGVRVVFLEGEPEAGERAASVPVVMVDARALVRVEGRAGVFIVDRGTALFRAISASAERLGRVVVEEGLEGGETVVLAPPAALSDGDRIRVKKEQE